MSRARLRKPLLCLGICLLLGACAAAPGSSSSVIKTLHDIGAGAPYRNVLVVSAAGDRSSRGWFERALVAEIAGDDTKATAFFAVAGRSPISRNIINNAVTAREFDSILLVRRQGQERPELAPGRPTGRNFNLYLYDYEELNDLVPVTTGSTIAFVAEFYVTSTARKIWAIESLVFDAATVESALETQVANIAVTLAEDGLVEN